MKNWSDKFFKYPIAQKAYSDFCRMPSFSYTPPPEIMGIAANQFRDEHPECPMLSYELARDFLKRI